MSFYCEYCPDHEKCRAVGCCWPTTNEKLEEWRQKYIDANELWIEARERANKLEDKLGIEEAIYGWKE